MAWCLVFWKTSNEACASWTHSQANTTYRYVNANVETAKRVAAALDAFNAEATEAAPPAELVH
jgi:hypothetical protein